LKRFFSNPQSVWWLAVGLLAIVLVLVFARRLYGWG
jgi:hypothetical protein